ncbi:MAG: rhodanese-like domain-containing protein [Puia sp.]|nr:rhodanese-like domain-containing protein [Puia sp.]
MTGKSLLTACFVLFSAAAGLSFAGFTGEEPWKPAQLLAPQDLAKIIADPHAKQPYIFCVGPGALIPGSIDVGPARDSGNIDKFRRQLEKLPKDARIVIYCGCCPFVHCPNIRPAFTLLNELHFAHPQLLNLENNLKTDWINKGYPVTK